MNAKLYDWHNNDDLSPLFSFIDLILIIFSTMTKQLHYDHNSFTQSVLAIFLNTIYKTELE